jgi:hypothetical protein
MPEVHSAQEGRNGLVAARGWRRIASGEQSRGTWADALLDMQVFTCI